MLPLKPHIRFALMVDYVDQTVGRKLILVGVFDRFLVRRQPDGGVVVNAGNLVAQIECSIAYGAEHRVVVECVNADGGVIFKSTAIPIRLAPQGDGLPLRGVLRMQIEAIPFPDFGAYEWCLRDEGTGEEIGRCPFAVWERTPT